MPAGPLLLVDDAHLVLDRTLSRLLGARYDTRVVSLDAEAALSVLSQPPPSRCAGRTNTRRSI